MRKLLFRAMGWAGALPLALLAADAPAQTMMDLSTIDLGIQQIQETNSLSLSINQTMMSTSPGSSSSSRKARPGQSGAKRGATGAPAVSAVSAASTLFTPIGSPIVPKQVAAAWKPEKRAEAESIFSGWLDEYRGFARAKGVAPNDVARAASYLIASIGYVEQGGRNLSPAQLEPMRRQMHDLFASDPAFQRMSNRERQQLFELYIIQANILTDQFEQARKEGNRKLMDKVHNLNRRWSLMLLKVPLEKVRFTNAGIVTN